MTTVTVKMQLMATSQAIYHENVINTYQKGDMYCIFCINDGIERVIKYPLTSIFRVTEEYGD